MARALPLKAPVSQWSDAEAAGLGLEELLLYRSNLLGADLVVTNFGGGNTSAKLRQASALSGEQADVLWVKGSGGDLGSMGLDGFATLYLDKLLMLEDRYRGPAHEDEMVACLPYCAFNLNQRAASIDTPLHAYLPYAHVDHMHPDAVIAVAAAKNGEEITRQIYGDEIGWLAWRRPGFELGLILRDYARERPGLKGIVLENHGLFTWGDDAKSCYENTISVISRAVDYLNARMQEAPAFGGCLKPALDARARDAAFSRLMPEIRARVSAAQPKIGHRNDSPEVLEFVCAERLDELAAIGTSCPDHFLRTKIRPLGVSWRINSPAMRFPADARDVAA